MRKTWARRVAKAISAILLLGAAGLTGYLFYTPGSWHPAQLITVRPTGADGFAWPYLLYIPGSLRGSAPPETTRLLVAPNNSGSPKESQAYHGLMARAGLLVLKRQADALQTPLLIPVFPRPATDTALYTHALDRDSLTTDKPGLQRLDLQLLAMVDDARGRVARATGVTVEEQVLMWGFSASGMFVNRFVMLHPERVRAAAIHAPGGWPVAPLGEYEGLPLRYPVGVGDLDELVGAPVDLDQVRQVPLLFTLGSADTNDSVPYWDGYDPEDRELIFAQFGDTPVERWPVAEELYRRMGLDARFLLLPGAGHFPTGEALREQRDFLRQAP